MKTDAKPFVYSSIIIVSILAVILVIVFGLVQTEDIRSSPIDAEFCKAFVSNGGQYNILFFADKDTTEKYANYLLDFPAIKENKDAFNIYYNDLYKAECENYKGIALLCYSRKIIQEAAKCPSDYIVVVKEDSESIRSSSYVNVMSINSVHPLSVIAHEFGHSFAFLAEEYEYENARLPSKAKNCVKECSDFEISEGCFEGCTYSDYKRSIDDGIMRTLFGARFGIFNDKIIKERIPQKPSSITGNAIVEDNGDCAEKKYYLIEAIYNSQQEQIAILDTSFEQGCSGNGYGNFDYELHDKKGNLLYKESFNPESIFTDGQYNEEDQINGEIFASDKAFILRIPTDLEAEIVVITKEEKRIEIKIDDLKPRAVINKEIDTLSGITKEEVIVKNFEASVNVETQSAEGVDNPYLSDGEGSRGESNQKGETQGSGSQNGDITGALIFLEDKMLNNPDYLALIIVCVLVLFTFLIRKLIIKTSDLT